MPPEPQGQATEPTKSARLDQPPVDGRPRIAWIVEYRAAELTDEERQLVRDATTRMLSALEHDTG